MPYLPLHLQTRSKSFFSILKLHIKQCEGLLGTHQEYETQRTPLRAYVTCLLHISLLYTGSHKHFQFLWSWKPHSICQVFTSYVKKLRRH
ncbi:hypothetical protein J6590_075653 [Homalodisca vitripennis]|nr:hypothetical protein J6590_086718 [Homalodisca vitripennis]KAG8305152.1 hypothetical protein J6590_075653 [Homalodisca vitripennis]